MKKSLVTLIALLGLVLTGWADQTWKTSVASGLYSEPTNWKASAVPTGGEFGLFDMSSATEDFPAYTVTFPAGGFTDTSVTRLKGLKDGQSLVFDATGTTWYKGPGSLAKSAYPLSLCAEGTTKDFFRLQQKTSGEAIDAFSLEDGVLTCSYATASGSQIKLSGGVLNWYDPSGTKTSADITAVVGRENTNVTLTVKSDASFRAYGMQLFDGTVNIEGGDNAVFGDLSLGGSSATYAERNPELNFLGGTTTIGGGLNIGSLADLADATVSLSGSSRVLLTGANKSTSVGSATGARAHFFMSDSAYLSNTYFRVGCNGNLVAAKGQVEMTDSARIDAVAAFVGYSIAANGRGDLTMSGDSQLNLSQVAAGQGFNVGFGSQAAAGTTGVVSMAGNACVQMANNAYFNLGGGVAGVHGVLNMTDHAVLNVGNWYMGNPGSFAVNMAGDARAKTPYFASGWIAGGVGTIDIGGRAQVSVGSSGALVGHLSPVTFVLRDHAEFSVSQTFQVADGATGSGSATIRDNARLTTVNNLKLGHVDSDLPVLFRVQDDAVVTIPESVEIKGRNSCLELAGGSFEERDSNNKSSFLIYGGNGTYNGLKVSGGNHSVACKGGLQVASVAGTSATVGTIELLGGRLSVAKIVGGAGSTLGGGSGKAVLKAAGGTVVPTVADATLIEKFDEATLGAGGLTIEVPAEVPVKVAQAFTDETAGEGMIVKTGAGTLTAAANSAHGVTRIEGGTVTLGAGVTQFGKKLVLAGVTYTVDGEFPFEALQLGDADSTGTLVLATPDKLPITDAAKFVVSNGVIRFTASPALGDYTFLELTGDVDKTMFDRLDILDPDGNNRYGFTFDAEGGKTTVTLRVVDVPSITDVTWAGTESGAWATDANWNGDSKATALNNAVFPAEATTKQVSVDRNEAADQLKFTGGDYELSGDGQLRTYGMLVTNGATVAVSAPVVPKGSFTLDVAEDAALDFASSFASPFEYILADGLVKKGLGPLALTGSRTLNTLDWNLRGGRTTVTNDAAIGGPAAGVTIGACTLKFPEGGTYARDVTLDAGATDQFAVMEVTRDTVISGALDSVSGAFIKRGTGTLEVDYPAGQFTVSVGQGVFDRNIGPADNKTKASWTNEVVFPANGESPDVSTSGIPKVGLGGFNVAEGLVRLRGDSATTLAQTNWTVVGVNYPEQAAEAELEISGGLTLNNAQAAGNADFRRFVIGQRTNKDVPFRHPTLRVIDGATLKAQGIWVGTAYDVETYPTLAVTNATVIVDSQLYFNIGDGNNKTCRPIIRIGSGGSIVQSSYASGDWRYTIQVGMFTDCDVDGGSITIPYNARGGLLIGHCGCGQMAFRNGGKLTVPMIYANMNRNTDKQMTDMVFLFDGGILEMNNTKESIVSSPNERYVQIEGGGLTVAVGNGITSTMRLPFRGTGALTKTGTGTFVLGVGKENVYSKQEVISETKLSGLTTAAYAGKTTVAEGTLVFEEGELVATKEVKVAAGATLELSNAETAYGFETLSGAGTVRNGTIGRCAIACDGTSALTFDNVTLGAVTVDFGHDETDPIDLATLAGLKIAQLDNGSTATKWKIAGTGHKNVRGTFVVQDDGSVILAEARMNGLLLIVR